ncbi:MAG: T9SS type A sorting domain-containing protein, partial [Candidatus Zixiibacteriota bacterium]
DYVQDPDDPDSVITWTHWGEVELSVDITDRVATITAPDPDWDGLETIWFKACDPAGLCDSNQASFTVLVSGVTDEDSSLSGPFVFLLNQNHPNPFNLQTNITYSVSTPGRVNLTIYDLLGRRVRTLADENQTPGEKSLDWDGKDDKGNTIASGIYFYRLEAGQLSNTKKMLLLK